MRKFLTKAKKQLLILGLIIACMITIAGNVSLAVNKTAIEREVDNCFNHDVSIGPVFYIFPNYLILHHIVISKADDPLKASSFTLPKTVMSFSFVDMIFNGFLNVSKVTLYPSTVSYYALSRFLEDNFQEILEIIKNSPDKNIVIRIKETLLDFDQQGQPDYIAMELLLKIRNNLMEGTGFFRADQYRYSKSQGEETQRTAQGWPLWYKLKSRLRPNGLEVDHLILRSQVLHSKLRGGIRGGMINVNGFVFMNSAKKDFDQEKYSTVRYFRHFPEEEALSNVDTFILDIDGKAALMFPDINIEKFDFTLNNIPVALQGVISIQQPLSVNASLSFDGIPASAGKGTFFEKAGVKISGTLENQAFHANGEGFIDFIDHKGLSLSPEAAQADFQGLLLYFDQHQRPSIDLAHGNIFYWVNKNEHKVSVRDVEVRGNIKMEAIKLIEITAPFYEGQLKGRMWIDSTQRPSKITSRVELTDVDTDAMEELLIHFAKFNGRMFSTMNFTNIPRLALSGDVIVHDGTLTDLAFFNWLSDTFQLPDLKAIDFRKASAQFFIDSEHIQLRDIRLRAKDVRVGGYYDMDKENLVSSKLGLSLSQGLLGKSPKFKPILKIFKDDDPYLGFDFQLSGNMNTMNFQWLPSEVKRRIQTRIPDFIERLIEKDVDAMMDAGSKKSRKAD
ncbi:MAG: hypothetical protein JW847_07795 [Candidatus Omnitrophica bacterium]|nr:hypothetical protein [Candidatus Omnitrophota bacterium]